MIFKELKIEKYKNKKKVKSNKLKLKEEKAVEWKVFLRLLKS